MRLEKKSPVGKASALQHLCQGRTLTNNRAPPVTTPVGKASALQHLCDAAREN
tara:strand:- start:50036 stop:50194 length:159 start_codon:yes stop_codon:yes gene_type:complete